MEAADAAEDASGSAKVSGDAVVGNEGKAEEEGVRAVTRLDPILPSVQVVTVQEHPAREAGRLAFGGLVEGRDDLAETQLPLFDRAKEGPRVAMLELADARGGPVMARGRGAPLDLRLFVAACIMTPLAARETKVPLVTTVRELRDFCFPNGWKKRRDWPALRTALGRARDYAIPWVVGTTAGGWWPVAVRFAPGRNAQLDDQVILDVSCRRGRGVGPVITKAGTGSTRRHVGDRGSGRTSPCIRSRGDRGVTRRPHPRNPDFHLWSADAANYLVLTRADRQTIGVRCRRQGASDAGSTRTPLGRTCRGSRFVTRKASNSDGNRGWLVLPEKAAAAIRTVDAGNPNVDEAR